MHGHRTRRTLPGLTALIAVLVAWTAWTHIVPPEKFHPIAEAHRRLTFLVNLNPIPWEQVRRDTDTISASLSSLSHGEGLRYSKSLEEAFMALDTEARISSPTPTMRKQTARRVFEESTRAVGWTLSWYLTDARVHLSDYDRASASFDTARQVWAAFEYEIQSTDPETFRDLGRRWLACGSALGSPGMLGVGVALPDSEIFDSESARILSYISLNFGPDYMAEASGRLAPLPTRSPTFDPTARVLAKLPPGHNINKQLPRPRQVLNMVERGVDESETPLIALGDMAFDSPYIFRGPSRELALSCNTCHNKGTTNPNFFIPGLSTRPGTMDVSNAYLAPHANNGVFDALDIPDLRGIRFTAPYGRNGRFASLRDFVRNGIMHEFDGPEPDPILLDAMIAYMNEFDFLPNPALLPNGRLAENTSEAAKRGEALFRQPFAQMDERSCATCHDPSNQFLDGRQHDIGSTRRSGVYALDGALDTPTLLNAKFTAPYFHDGSLDTLEDVVRWFDATYALDLPENEIGDLTAYLETVGDGIDSYEDTIHTLEPELEEFSFFLSAYEYVDRIDRPEMAATIFQTIASELRAHKWSVQDMRLMPVLDQLTNLMDEAYRANQMGDRAAERAHVEAYRAMYAANKDVLK